MKKKYMDQMMFDYLAASVAKLSLMYPRSDDQITEELWSGYQDAIIDDNVRADVLRAARTAKDYLRKCEDPAPSQFFHDLQYYIKHYDEKGKRRRFRFFGGLFFMKSVQNPRRVDDFLKILQVYYAGRTLGVMPRAKGIRVGLTGFQHFWVALCSLGPALVLGITKSWWLGIGALFLHYALSAALGWGLLAYVPPRLLAIWGYAKSLLIASVILAVGLSLF